MLPNHPTLLTTSHLQAGVQFNYQPRGDNIDRTFLDLALPDSSETEVLCLVDTSIISIVTPLHACLVCRAFDFLAAPRSLTPGRQQLRNTV